MNGVNLIPESRRSAASAARRLRRWARGVLAYAILAAVAGAFLRLPAGAEAQNLRFAIADADTRLEKNIREADAARSRIDRLQRTIDTHRLVAEHPDWSVLLTLLSTHRDDKVVLDSCEIAPVYPQDDKRNPLLLPPVAEVFRLRLSGMGVDQSSVTDYSRALESSRAFSRVELLQTLSRDHEGRKVVGFSIECTLAASPRAEARP